MLAYAEVMMGGGQATCRRCPTGTVIAPRGTDAVLDEVAGVSDAAGGCVALAGGDLFARSGWRDLVKDAIAAGASRLRVDAGPALLDRVTAAEALAAGVRHVRVRLLSAHAATGDALSGEPGSTERTLGAVRAFLAEADAAGCKAVVTAVVPVCRHVLQDLPGTVTALAEAGAASVVLSAEDDSLPAGPAAAWLAAAADSGTVNRTWVRIEGFPADSLPGYALHFTTPFAVGRGL